MEIHSPLWRELLVSAEFKSFSRWCQTKLDLSMNSKTMNWAPKMYKMCKFYWSPFIGHFIGHLNKVKVFWQHCWLGLYHLWAKTHRFKYLLETQELVRLWTQPIHSPAFPAHPSSSHFGPFQNLDYNAGRLDKVRIKMYLWAPQCNRKENEH